MSAFSGTQTFGWYAACGRCLGGVTYGEANRLRYSLTRSRKAAPIVLDSEAERVANELVGPPIDSPTSCAFGGAS